MTMTGNTDDNGTDVVEWVFLFCFFFYLSSFFKDGVSHGPC